MTSNRLLKALILCPILLCIGLIVNAQKTITGKITDSAGAPITGASVIVKGGKTGTTTDASGSFTLNVPANAKTVVVSYIGYSSQEASIESTTQVTVALLQNNANLTDVIVVGYGTTRKKDLTGSVAAITPKDFNKGVIATPEQLIQGRTPGITITPSSGEPGAASVINIRGSSSIRGDQQPLYVIDGVPVSNGGTSGTASGVEGSSTPKNPLFFLNPNDIQSITILKDASASAIYGSRGANGVILITTKSGRGAGGIQLNINESVANAASTYDLLSAGDFLAAVKAANIAAGTSDSAAAVAIKTVDKGASTDWQNVIFRPAYSQSYNLSGGFGHKSTSVRLSGSYDDQQGIIENSELKRLTARGNLTQKLFKDKIQIDAALTYANVKDSYAPITNNAGYQGSLIGAAITFNPTYPIYNPDSTFFDPKDGNRNPAEMLAYFDDHDKINRFLGSVTLTYKIFDALSYKLVLGYDDSKSERLSFADPRLSSNAFGGTNNVFGKDLQNQIQGNGRGVKQNLHLKNYLIEHYLTYDKQFGGGHTINAVAGFSYQKYETESTREYAWGLNSPVVKATDVFDKNFDAFVNHFPDVPYNDKSELQSVYGRVNYNYMEKYYITGTVRVDGSSRFGSANRYATFPAGALKWRVLQENFASSLKKTFNDISLRANYGVLGAQDGIGAYDADEYALAYDVNNTGTPDTSRIHQASPHLKWEQAATTGGGIDIALLDNRIGVTVDYFYTRRKDLLYFGPVPGQFSAQAYYFSNLPGRVINQGWEFNVNLKPIVSKKFSWELNYNMTFIKNRVEGVGVIANTGAVSGQGLSGAYAQTIQDGYPLFSWKMPVYLGFDGNGDARYANGGVDQIVGSALPKFNAGLTNTFNYGNWSLSVFAYAVTGFYVYNNTANALFLKGSIKTAHNVTYEVANSNEDPINPGSVSTRFLEKGDFLRLSNAILSYNFNLHNKVIKTLAVNVSGQNLALFTDYSGLDPEVNVDKNISGVPSRGFDYVGFPKPRTFSLGINVGF